jgi:KDO2-lipid IV(A) lauroyltransferase
VNSTETRRHPRPWYTHAWNTTTSLRLIFTIIPRLPRWLVPPIGVVTTAICLAYMKRERRAATQNLRRILGREGWPLWLAVWSLFYSFSRFMVSYCDLAQLSPASLQARLVHEEGGLERLGQALQAGRGLIVLTAHLGNWEVGTRLLELTGAPVNVVMQRDRGSSAERWLMRARQQGRVRVLGSGEGAGAESVLALRAALARNEILAMQGDRAAGRTLELELFGAPFAFPMGPFLLAYGCDAPLLPAFVIQQGWWRWRSEIDGPIRFPRTGNREADLEAGAAEYARALERVVREHPDQWFNFFEMWP